MVNDAVSIGSGTDEGMSYTDLKNIPALYRERYDESKLIKTGFHLFDNALDGGMAPGEIHVVQAPPKVGKSTLAPNFGILPLCTGKSVFHVTLEISDLDVLAKYGTRFSGLTYKQLKDSTNEQFGLIMNRYDKYEPRLFVKYWTPQTVNTLAIRSWISKIRSKHGIKPDLIIIDYDDLLLPIGGSKDDMYNDASQVYFDMKGLADYFACPILTFAQPNRTAWELMEKGELIHSYHMAHSAKKIMQAYSVSSLNFQKPKDGERPPPHGILFVDLNRRGESSVKIPITRELNKGRITERLQEVSKNE